MNGNTSTLDKGQFRPIPARARCCSGLIAIAFMIVAGDLPGSAVAQTLTPPKQDYNVGPTGVNYIDGQFTNDNSDLSIGDLTLTRTYISAPYGHKYMASWNHNFDIWIYSGIISGNSEIHIVIGPVEYVFTGSGSPWSANAQGLAVTQSGSLYIFTDRDGTTYTFPNSNSQVSYVTRPDGRVTSFSYVSGKLKLVSSNKGYGIVFDYSGSNVSSACGFNLAVTYVTTSTTCASAVLKTGYTYTNGDLTAFTDVMGSSTHYAYNGGLSCLTDPGTSACKVTNYYVSGRTNIYQQVMADGTTWQISCGCNSVEDDPNQGGGYTDPLGNSEFVNYIYGNLNLYVDKNGKQYNLNYSGPFPLSIQSPEGNMVSFAYTSGMAETTRTSAPKTGSGLTSIVSEAKTYPSNCTNAKICNQPLTLTDAKGKVTYYTYDSAHGGILTETKPADSTGVSAVVRHAYAQKYAYIKNSAGGYSPAATPVWLLVEDRTCRTTATVGSTCAGGSSDEVITTYDYGPASGPNTLLLRGAAITADGATRRTCYGYDWQGNKISETKPRAGLAVCS